MNLSARISALIELLEETRKTARPADGVLSQYLRARRYIGSRDRRWLAESTFAIWRHWARLNWHLEQFYAEPTTRRIVIAWLLLVDQMPVDELRELFKGHEKYSPKPLKPAEHDLIDRLAELPLEPEDMPEGVRDECPDWARDMLVAAFGQEGEALQAEFAAMAEEAPLDLRVNTLLGTRDDALRQLEKADIPAIPTPYSPIGIRVLQRASITHLPLFQKGLVEVQDEGSQLIGHAVEAGSAKSVVDFCAGAGGKTLLLAAAMGNKGRLVACDVVAGRLNRSKDRLKRAGVHNVMTQHLNGETDRWVKRNEGKFDRVLLDVPCLGTGTWRRNPDMRWRKGGVDLTELLPLQASILEHASVMVKPGGRLIYGTCSLLPPENEDQVAAFLAKDASYTRLDIRDIFTRQLGQDATAALGLETPYMQLTPARHGTDGFYCTVLEKTG